MTNFEKVKEEMRIEDVGSYSLCDAIHRIRKELLKESVIDENI